MKEAKKLLLLLAVVVVTMVCFALSASAEKDGHYTYEVSDGEAAITSVNSWFGGDITIPSTLGGYKVRSISSYAFYYHDSLTGVIIPDSVTSIGNSAFEGCTSLTRITIPDGVTTIASSAFEHCTSLESITIPDSVTSIEFEAFNKCENLKDVYYTGSEEEWNTITIDSRNDSLTNATIHYNFCFHENQTEQPQTDSTCTDIGYTEGVYCNDCEQWLMGHEKIEAIGHKNKYLVNKEDPDCYNVGYTSGMYCPDCKQWLSGHEEIASPGHTVVVDSAVAPTCTKTGLTEGSHCGVCGEVLSLQETVDELGHSDKTTTTKATLTKNGKIETKCTVCGKVSKSTTIYYPKSISLSTIAYTYNGKAKKPSVTVKDSKGNTLKKDTDYTVKYESGRKTPGKYTVQITFKGKYSGTKKLYFTIAPKSPTKLTASQSTTSIKLTWSKVTGATGYRVYKYNSKTKKYEKLKDVTATSLTISKLSAGTKYKFKVRAYTKDGDTIWGAYSSEFVTATKPATLTLKVTSSSKGKATLTWTNVSGESGYQIYYSTKKDSGFKLYGTAKADTTKATVSKLTSGKTYYFRVRAFVKTDSGTVYSGYKTVSVKVK